MIITLISVVIEIYFVIFFDKPCSFPCVETFLPVGTLIHETTSPSHADHHAHNGVDGDDDDDDDDDDEDKDGDDDDDEDGDDDAGNLVSMVTPV